MSVVATSSEGHGSSSAGPSSAAAAAAPSSSSTTPPFSTIPPSSTSPPNAIPPRRSSTGQQQHQQQQLAFLLQQQQQQQPPHAASHSSRHHHHTSSTASSTASAVLTPLLETGKLGSQDTLRRPRKTSVAVSGGIANGVVPAGILPGDFLTGAIPSAGLSPAPPPDALRYATADFNFGARRTWTEEKERVVCGPFDYLNGVRGKEFRTQLVNAFNGWLEVPAEQLDIITHVVGMLHTASLLVDDVEDSSSLRRGLPVAHNIFGVAQTINSANYIYFAALQELQRLRNPMRALAVFAEELCNLHRGQGMDLFWRDTLTCPTEDDYLEMVGHKTGGLFRLAIKLMQAESRALVDCVPLVNLLGLLFQIQDDYRNLLADEYSQNKGMCEDLSEGKFSFPVIHSVRSDPSNLQLLNILRQKTADEVVKRYAVDYMERTGSFAYTRRVLAVLTARARAMADDMDQGQGRSQAVHAILDRLVIPE